MSWSTLPGYGKRNSKYHNKKVVIDGIKFDSTKEGNRYRELKLMLKAGEIYNLRLQVPYELVPKVTGREPTTGRMVTERRMTYVADFVYVDRRTGKEVVEDAKGFRTPEYKCKRKIFLWRYGFPITEV